MFCDNCGNEIEDDAPYYRLDNGDCLCEGCWEDYQNANPDEEGK